MGERFATRLCVGVLAIGTTTLLAAVLTRPDPGHATLVRAEGLAAGAVHTAAPVVAETTTTAPTTTTTSAPPATTSAPPATAGHRVVVGKSPQAVGEEALGLITYPWRQRLNVSITFAGPRSGYRAVSTAYRDHDVLVVYVRATDTPRIVAVNIAHELGHLIDYHRLNDDDRREWRAARGRPDVAWWTCDYCQDYATGSGDFAETFAAWQVGPLDYRSRVAPLPSPAEMTALARFFK